MKFRYMFQILSYFYIKKNISSETGLGFGGYHLQCFTEKLTDSVFNSTQSDKHGLKDHKFV